MSRALYPTVTELAEAMRRLTPPQHYPEPTCKVYLSNLKVLQFSKIRVLDRIDWQYYGPVILDYKDPYA